MNGGIIYVAVFVGIIVVYLAYGATLSIIADKAGVKDGWRAWIPIFNFFLEFDLASLSYMYFLVWFVVGFLASAARVASVLDLFSLIFSMYIWARICDRFGKSPWLGILGGLPILSLFLQIYLAMTNTSRATVPATSVPPIASTIAALPVDLGIYNFIKNGISGGKSKEQIFSELQTFNISNDRLETAYAQAQKEVPVK